MVFRRFRAALLLSGFSLLHCVFAVSAGSAQTAQARTSPAKGSSRTGETFQALAAQANAARDAQQLDKAVTLFRKALALRPRWTEGWWSLGTIYYDADQYAPAAEAFQHILKLDSHQGTARAMLGLCEFELGHDASALQAIEASKEQGILEDAQLRQVVLFHEGVLLQRAGRFQGAQAAFSSLCLAGVRSNELVQRFGMTALRMRAESPAPGEAADVVELVGRGACLAAVKNYEDARREYEAALARHAGFPYLQYAYGRLLLDARERDGAIQAFQREIANQPDDVFARFQIAAAQYKVDSAAGLRFAEEAVRLAPLMPFAHYLLGLLQIDLGDDANAVQHLEIARKAFPQEAKIYWSLATAYVRLGRTQDAAKARADFARVTAQATNAGGNAQRDDASSAAQVEVSDSMAESK